MRMILHKDTIEMELGPSRPVSTIWYSSLIEIFPYIIIIFIIIINYYADTTTKTTLLCKNHSLKSFLDGSN